MNEAEHGSSAVQGLSERQTVLALIWLPVQIFILPRFLTQFYIKGIIDEAQINLIIYGAGAVYMLLVCFGFLRSEFDTLCDHPVGNIAFIMLSYIGMLGLNMCVSGILLGLEYLINSTATVANANNETLTSLAMENYGTIAAAAVFLAPITEEMVFRGAIFGTARKRSRTLAYVLTMLVFSVYHVWNYAMEDPWYWIYIIQYLPAGFMLCRVYEKTNSIWCSIFFHMLVNGVAMNVLTQLQQMV